MPNLLSVQEDDQLRALATGICAGMGLELVSITVNRHHGEVGVVVITDLPRGGINVDQCSAVNRALSAAIDLAGMWLNGYTLEVSSPGLDWPLTTPADFRRNAGREARVWLKDIVAGKKEHAGILSAATADFLEINANGNAVQISWELVVKGVRIF